MPPNPAPGHAEAPTESVEETSKGQQESNQARAQLEATGAQAKIPKPWAALTLEEKIERLREITHEVACIGAENAVKVGQVQGDLANHLHDADGRVYVKRYIHDERPRSFSPDQQMPQRDYTWRTDPQTLW